MGNEKAERIQTSILNAAEKKALVWLAERQPKWITSDSLTYIGIFGAVLCAAGFVLSSLDLNWLWLSSFGLVVNWYGDSLDGTLARVRHTQRPVYGFFIDHNVDIFTISIMCIGAGLSPFLRLDVALFVLVGYLALSIHTYIGTILKNEFKLTYGKLGPTEFRLIVIIINTLFIYVPSLTSGSYVICGEAFGIFDFIAMVLALILAVLLLISVFKEKCYFSRLDPLKPSDDKRNSK